MLTDKTCLCIYNVSWPVVMSIAALGDVLVLSFGARRIFVVLYSCIHKEMHLSKLPGCLSFLQTFTDHHLYKHTRRMNVSIQNTFVLVIH